MKRVLGLLFIAAVCIIGYLSVWGYLPFMPVIGSSMEPEIRSGSLLITEPLMVAGVKEGDFVAYYVPLSLRENSDYPPVVARRVVDVSYGTSGLQLLIKGDSADTEPFPVTASDIKGVVRNRIPYLGFPLIFLHSRLGMVLTPIAFVLLALLLYLDDILSCFRRRYRESVTPIVEESHRVSLVLSNRFESTEKAVERFASSMQEYAHHLDSHTSAVRGLSEASQALKNSAVEQNQILSKLSQPPAPQKPEKEISGVEKVVSDLEERTQLFLQVKDELEGKILAVESAPPEETLTIEVVKRGAEAAEIIIKEAPVSEIPVQKVHVEELRVEKVTLEEKLTSPPGCLGNPKALYRKEHIVKSTP